jgi:dihydropyrimidinase
VAIGERLSGRQAIEANGLLVLPGGVDSHCHNEQLQAGGDADEETFITSSRSALVGGRGR